MVIVASGVASAMVHGRVRLATKSPQQGGHSHSVEGLQPKRGFVFRALFAHNLQPQYTAVYSVC